MSSAGSHSIPNRQSPSEPYRSLRSLVEEGLGPVRVLAVERAIAIDLVGSSSLPVAIPASPFADIIRSLVTTAVMECRRGSRIEIAWHRSRDEMVLTVRDEGLPSRRGAASAVPAACADPLRELRGSMDVIAGRPGGTEVRLTIPVTHGEAR